MVLASLKILRLLLVISIIPLVIGGILGIISFATEPYYTKELTLYSYTKNSEITITLLLKPNRIYEKTTAILIHNSTYLNLVEGVDVGYVYRVFGGSFVGNYNLTISLSHPDGWSKRYLSIVDRINGSSMHTRSMINISEIVIHMENICKQISMKVVQFDVVIEVKTEGYVRANYFSAGDQQLHRAVIHIDLLNNKISTHDGLVQNTRVDKKSSIQEVNYLLGFSITFARTLSLVITSTGFMGFIAYTSMYYVRIKKVDVIKDFESRYHELIIESRDTTKVARDSIYVSSLEELAKTARILEKPITKIYGDGVMYVVLDKDIMYVFRLKG